MAENQAKKRRKSGGTRNEEEDPQPPGNDGQATAIAGNQAKRRRINGRTPDEGGDPPPPGNGGQATETSSELASRDSESSSLEVADGESCMGRSRGRPGGGMVTISVPGHNAGEITAFKREQNIYHEHVQSKVTNVIHGSGNFMAMVERTTANMAASCPQGFVETAGYSLARDLLETQGRCVVTGQAGSGKTTLACRLMKHFSSQGFECVELLSPDEFKEVPWRPNQEEFKLVVFIDDVVGRSNLEVDLKKKWEKKLEKTLPFLSTGHVKLVLASREHIFAAFREGSERDVLSGTPEVALACEQLVLPFLERKQILINAMIFKRVSLPGALTANEVVKAAVDSQQIGYPQLCWFFVTNDVAQVDPIQFFSNPVEFLKKEFASLKVDDKKSFFVLLLVLLREGKLTQNFLRSKSARFLSKVATDVVCLSRVPKFGEIKSTAKEMCKSYLRFDRDTKAYLFAHQSVWDTLFVYLCEEDFGKAMKICSCKQVMLYVTTEGCGDSGRGFIYTAPRDEWKVLARKLLQELTSGATLLACSHPCLQDPAFVQALRQEFLQEEDVRALLTPKAEPHTLRDQTHKISAKDYSSCSLKCGEFLNVATSAGCKGQVTMKPLLQYSHPVSFLAAQKCCTLVQHILDSDYFSALADDAKSRVLTEVLGCTCFTAKASFVEELLQRGAAPSAESVLAACSAQEEDVALVERLLQWRHLLTAEQQVELARVSALKDRPRTLQLLLSGLSLPGDDRALLDSVLAELVLLTHGANLISFNQSLELSNFSPLFALLTEAGARLLPQVSLCLAAGHWEPTVFQTLVESLAAATEKDAAPAVSVTNCPQAAQTSSGSVISTDKDVPADPAEKKQDADDTSAASTPGTTGGASSDPPVKKYTAVLSAKDDAGNTPLHWAARFGVLPNVQLLLKLSGQDGQSATLVNAQNKRGYSALHLAAEHGNLHVAVALLAAEVDSKLLNKNQDSALHLATQKGHSAVVDALVQSGANVNSANDKKNTALHVAAKSGQLQIVGTLLQHGADADLTNQQGHTALHLLTSNPTVDVGTVGASAENPETADKETASPSSKIVRSLIAATSKSTGSSCETDPPLHRAARQGQLSMVRILLDTGADVDARNSKGLTALHEAAGHCHLHIADLLLSRDAKTDQTDAAGNTVLHALASSNLQSKVDSGAVEHFQVAKIVKKWDAFVNAVNGAGDTAVMTALSKGNLFLVTEMLTRNPDLSLKNKRGNSVLHALAGAASLASGGHEDRSLRQRVAGLVGRFKACLDAVNEDGDTPLLTALHAGNFSVVKKLLDLGCSLKVSNKRGWRALHALAAGPVIPGDRDTQHTMRLVADKCSEFVNSQDEAGESPILIAAARGNIALVKCLLDHDADLSVLNKNKNSVLHALASAGDLTRGMGSTLSSREFVDRIVDGVSEDYMDLPNDAGDTPVMLALRSGNVLLAQSLLRRECDLSLVNSGGETVLHLLAQVGHMGAGRMLEEWREVCDVVVALANEIGMLPTSTDNKGVSPRAIASRLAEVHGERYSGRHLVLLWGAEPKPPESVRYVYRSEEDYLEDYDDQFQDDDDDDDDDEDDDDDDDPGDDYDDYEDYDHYNYDEPGDDHDDSEDYDDNDDDDSGDDHDDYDDPGDDHNDYEDFDHYNYDESGDDHDDDDEDEDDHDDSEDYDHDDHDDQDNVDDDGDEYPDVDDDIDDDQDDGDDATDDSEDDGGDDEDMDNYGDDGEEDYQDYDDCDQGPDYDYDDDDDDDSNSFNDGY